MAKKSGMFLRLLSSGKFENPRDEAVMEEMVRYVSLNVAIMAGAIFTIIFGITVYLEGNTGRGMADITMGILCIICVFTLRTRLPFIVSASLPVSAFGLLCAMLVFSGGAGGFAGLWIYAFPPIAIFIMGLRTGSVLWGLSFLALGAATFIPGLAGFAYPPSVAFRYCCVYVLTFLVTLMYEWIRLNKDRWVKRLTRTLKEERDEMSAMKDNLEQGLFLMNRAGFIQGQYSKALEKVLSAAELQGKNFLALLSSSMKAKDIDTLKDYFAMVIDGTFKQEMLKDMNPLYEFGYVSVETGEEKTLRCNFSAVRRESGEVFILGLIQDITVETKLQRRLAEEETKRQAEMRSLFEVIQVDPQVFGDFIEDTEYEFSKINDLLKDETVSSGDLMVNMYQSIHAVKSNALILGLTDFSGKLHDLESKIKNIRDKEAITFEDTLSLTVELKNIMREKDSFSTTINKINSFKIGEAKKQDHYVLVETLTQAAEKAAASMGKKVRFLVEGIDSEAMRRGPRRIMKEALTQLVRNAVYHGIEDPKERLSAGKSEEGLIRFSVKTEDENIRLVLNDDGRGLDIERIREKAAELKLIPEEKGNREKEESALIDAIFIPGFSTAKEADLNAGRGIGLNLVRDRIREARGSVKVQTQKGKGTNFTILIPMEENEGNIEDAGEDTVSVS
jgi:two-component system chemotaxis sensor kinase CheA